MMAVQVIGSKISFNHKTRWFYTQLWNTLGQT